VGLLVDFELALKRAQFSLVKLCLAVHLLFHQFLYIFVLLIKSLELYELHFQLIILFTQLHEFMIPALIVICPRVRKGSVSLLLGMQLLIAMPTNVERLIDSSTVL
jgi:hypothetical protein